ncbi:aldose 1-epimerase family protein [Intrasporangium calvum]|uniref:Aldose 1-epimerase family protein n=1 Tax=Intrasporangium calvum TaxID=53358 RepID=A0ABT5GN62_9MICO|nr:aldose 1-epimerase family protein [Intrasporangium calvum]MDC5699325.1 aldose 1-epimerase family protein [Intrasporangium calvum]
MTALFPEPARPSFAAASAAPTGQQWTIGRGPFEASVVEVGGGLRSLTMDGAPLVAGFGADEPCQSGRGQQLMPWPNRIRDGRYTWQGKQQQLPITEVPKGNASHGLVRWAIWELIELEPDSVTVGYRLYPQPGWDHPLDLRTTYVLDDTGLVVTAAARNVGTAPAPFGYGAHPYLAIGDTALDDVWVKVPASTWLQTDERGLPTGRAAVADTPLDLRTGRPLGDTKLDTPFTDVLRDPDGMWRCTVATGAAGRIDLWADDAFPWLQVFTGVVEKGLGQPGIAIEPMTCPAEAFNSGDSLITLAPGDEWTGTWGISPARGPVADEALRPR